MGGGRVADGTGRTAFFLATFFLDGAGEAAFFLVAVANGAGERELRTSRAGPCCRGWSGAEEDAEGDGLGGRAAAAVVDGAGERELPLSMTAVAEGRPPLLKLRQSDGRTMSCGGSDGATVVAAAAAPRPTGDREWIEPLDPKGRLTPNHGPCRT